MPGPAKKRLLNLLEEYKKKHYYTINFSYEKTEKEIIVTSTLPKIIKHPFEGYEMNRVKVDLKSVVGYLKENEIPYGDLLKSGNNDNLGGNLSSTWVFEKSNNNKIYKKLNKKLSKYKKIIYTVNVGRYDTLKDPTIVTPGWDYVCYTNLKTLKSDVWKTKPLPKFVSRIKDPKRKSSMMKIDPYKFIEDDYDFVVYVDASLKINTNLDKLVEDLDLLDNDMVVCRHPKRTDVFQEGVELININLADERKINKQVNSYKNIGIKPGSGLFESGTILRNKGHEDNKKFSELWMSEYRSGSRRDQMSYFPAYWKLLNLHNSDIKINVVPSLHWKNPNQYFILDRKSRYPSHKKVRFINEKK